MQTPTILTLSRDAPNYPQQLLDLYDPPARIYISGDAALINRQPLVAIVGARAASRQGVLDATFLAQGLVQRGFGVVSGLALGVDGAAHRSALAANGFTLAVGATGLDVVYPPQHVQLAEEIALKGLLLSEFPPGTAPRAFHFPRRNRLIAALCLGVVVVEAAAKSGSLITAHLAAELLKSTAGIDVQHVAYKGSAAALSEVMAGNINYVFDIISTALPQIQSGAVRALGWTGVTRSSLIPNVPTIAEAGLPGFDITGWGGNAGPSGIPANVLQRLHAAVSAAIKDADLRGRIMGQGYAIDLIEPAAFYALVKTDLAKWGKVVRDGNIKVE